MNGSRDNPTAVVKNPDSLILVRRYHEECIHRMNRSRLHGRLQPTKNERSTTSTATTTAAIEIDHFSVDMIYGEPGDALSLQAKQGICVWL